MSERPNRNEVSECINILNDIMLFVAMRNLWNKPEPSVIKTLKWLKSEFEIPEHLEQASAAVSEKEK